MSAQLLSASAIVLRFHNLFDKFVYTNTKRNTAKLKKKIVCLWIFFFSFVNEFICANFRLHVEFADLNCEPGAGLEEREPGPQEGQEGHIIPTQVQKFFQKMSLFSVADSVLRSFSRIFWLESEQKSPNFYFLQPLIKSIRLSEKQFWAERNDEVGGYFKSPESKLTKKTLQH